MSDISLATLAAASGITGVAGGLIGAATAIYARGRADGRRDEVIDRHEKRLEDGTQKLRALEVGAAANDKALAVLATKMDAVAASVDETRELVRDMAGRRRG